MSVFNYRAFKAAQQTSGPQIPLFPEAPVSAPEEPAVPPVVEPSPQPQTGFQQPGLFDGLLSAMAAVDNLCDEVIHTESQTVPASVRLLDEVQRLMDQMPTPSTFATDVERDDLEQDWAKSFFNISLCDRKTQVTAQQEQEVHRRVADHDLSASGDADVDRAVQNHFALEGAMYGNHEAALRGMGEDNELAIKTTRFGRSIYASKTRTLKIAVDTSGVGVTRGNPPIDPNRPMLGNKQEGRSELAEFSNPQGRQSEEMEAMTPKGVLINDKVKPFVEQDGFVATENVGAYLKAVTEQFEALYNQFQAFYAEKEALADEIFDKLNAGKRKVILKKWPKLSPQQVNKRVGDFDTIWADEEDRQALAAISNDFRKVYDEKTHGMVEFAVEVQAALNKVRWKDQFVRNAKAKTIKKLSQITTLESAIRRALRLTKANILDENVKLKKGRDFNLVSTGLSLTPAAFGQLVMCPFSSKFCRMGCLNNSGQGEVFQGTLMGMDTRNARLRRSTFYWKHKQMFLEMVSKTLESEKKEAKRTRRQFAARLNVLSDIAWEGQKYNTDPNQPDKKQTLFEHHPDITFYDYTKNPKRMKQYLDARNGVPGASWPENYHLVFSFSESNLPFCIWVLENGGGLAVPFNTEPNRKNTPTDMWRLLPKEWMGYPVIDGDLFDARFMDVDFFGSPEKMEGKEWGEIVAKGIWTPEEANSFRQHTGRGKGYVIGLRAKGRALRNLLNVERQEVLQSGDFMKKKTFFEMEELAGIVNTDEQGRKLRKNTYDPARNQTRSLDYQLAMLKASEARMVEQWNVEMEKQAANEQKVSGLVPVRLRRLNGSIEHVSRKLPRYDMHVPKSLHGIVYPVVARLLLARFPDQTDRILRELAAINPHYVAGYQGRQTQPAAPARPRGPASGAVPSRRDDGAQAHLPPLTASRKSRSRRS
jgi:hypothetical protein